MAKHTLTFTHTASFLTYVWPFYNIMHERVKGVLSGLTQFLATESPLKIMKNTFYFTLKALFVLKVFKFLFYPFGHVETRLG